MTVLAIDLAAKYSAGVRLDPHGEVTDEFDSAQYDETTFLYRISASYTVGHAQQLVVEDLPHGVSYRGLVKRVCQLQGRIAERMSSINQLDQLLYVDPATWRRRYEKLRARGSGMEAVIPVALDLGYYLPELPHLAGPRGGKTLMRKVHTDYCAAFLIAMWAVGTFAEHGTYDVPGTCRYGMPTIKKDKH